MALSSSACFELKVWVRWDSQFALNLPLQVPVLVDGELEITESPVVAEYILNKFGPSTGEWIFCHWRVLLVLASSMLCFVLVIGVHHQQVWALHWGEVIP